MGADGHIKIWRDDKVRERFPDCDDLFNCLPTHYTDDLDGTLYHHCYQGDNLYCFWGDEEDWRVFDRKKDKVFMDRLRVFVEWLGNNGKHWEVWT